ncbi:MAG TPA: MBL fold metallo-hydrolase [Ruminococcaceae bacterium]|nr:MBL fold metallo-hydrolase [Oscillospiraceae bacterium]
MIEVKCLASGSSGNSYAIDDGESVLLLEAGIPHKRILSGYIDLLPRVAGCCITHEHCDHSRGAAGLAASGIDLYATEGTYHDIDDIRHPYRKNIIRAGTQRDIGSWVVMPFETKHDAAEPVGFLLYSKAAGEKLLFATDTYYIQNRFSGLSVIMVECNYSLPLLRKNAEAGRVTDSMKHRLLESHFSLEHVRDFFKATELSQVRQIYLLHVSAGNGDKKQFVSEIKQATGRPVTAF